MVQASLTIRRVGATNDEGQRADLELFLSLKTALERHLKVEILRFHQQQRIMYKGA